MKQERVIAILDFYRDIDKTVTMNERVIRNLEDQYYSTLGAVNSDGMPHGKGGVSNPVERVVLNIPQSVSDTIANMRRENEKLTAIKGEILSELNALNYREKAVIYGFYIDGLQWERLSQRVNYSPRQCRNIRNIALERIAGDMWDGIAYKTLGDEAYMDRLMKLNPQYRRTFVFPAGITLTVPEPETRVSSDLPPWKRGTAE